MTAKDLLPHLAGGSRIVAVTVNVAIDLRQWILDHSESLAVGAFRGPFRRRCLAWPTRQTHVPPLEYRPERLENAVVSRRLGTPRFVSTGSRNLAAMAVADMHRKLCDWPARFLGLVRHPRDQWPVAACQGVRGECHAGRC